MHNGKQSAKSWNHKPYIGDRQLPRDNGENWTKEYFLNAARPNMSGKRVCFTILKDI